VCSLKNLANVITCISFDLNSLSRLVGLHIIFKSYFSIHCANSTWGSVKLSRIDPTPFATPMSIVDPSQLCGDDSQVWGGDTFHQRRGISRWGLFNFVVGGLSWSYGHSEFWYVQKVAGSESCQ